MGIKEIYSFPTNYESTTIIIGTGEKNMVLRFYAPDKVDYIFVLNLIFLPNRPTTNYLTKLEA